MATKFADKLKRGAVFFANLDPHRGSEQGGERPVVVIQNNIGNKYSPVTVVAAITSQSKKDYPGYVKIPAKALGLPEDGTVLINQLFTIDVNERFRRFVSMLPQRFIELIDTALKGQLALDVCHQCHTPLPPSGEVCTRCGIKVQNVCTQCSSVMNLDWDYCPSCGAKRGNA